MYVYVYIYIHTYMYKHTYIHTCIYICIYIYIYTLTSLRVYAHECLLECIHIHVKHLTYTRNTSTHKHTTRPFQLHLCPNTRMCLYIHTLEYSLLCIYMCAYQSAQIFTKSFSYVHIRPSTLILALIYLMCSIPILQSERYINM